MLGSNVGAEWDVVVVGAGPAGSAAAITSARAGLRVMLVDAKRFPRRKVCGGCLDRVSSRLLRQLLGEQHSLWETVLPLDSFQLTHRGRQFRFAMPEGIAVDRAMLDQSLVEAAQQSGVTFRDATSAKVLPADGDGRGVALSHAGGTCLVRSAAVVVASGLGNHTARGEIHYSARRSSRVGIEAIFTRFPPHYGSGSIHMVVARHGYVGLTQIGGRRLHVAAAVDRRALQRLGPAGLCQAILREAGTPPLLDDPTATWRGTRPLTTRATRLAAERVFLVGDAASYIEPFTGEGIRWALETGMEVTPFVVKAQHTWETRLIDEWECWYRQRIAPKQQLCRRIATGLQRTPMRWLAHQMLCLQPRWADSVIGRLNKESELKL